MAKDITTTFENGKIMTIFKTGISENEAPDFNGGYHDKRSRPGYDSWMEKLSELGFYDRESDTALANMKRRREMTVDEEGHYVLTITAYDIEKPLLN